jgi:hypothetical protein
MINAPKTKDAEGIRYGIWAGNPSGVPYKPGNCAYEIFEHFGGRQCSRTSGYGLEGLYCWQHAKKIKMSTDYLAPERAKGKYNVDDSTSGSNL